MAQICHTCRYLTAVINCVSEGLNFCLTCDYMHHRNNLYARHVRYQLCDNCKINPALLLCSDEGIVICQPCYSLHCNCSNNGHHIQVVNSFPVQYHNNNNNNQHNDQQMPHVVHQQMPHVVHHNNNNNQQVQQVGGNQRRAGMFERYCNGNNNCERWMYAMNCETCLASNAVVYCSQHNKLLCNNCDPMIHLHETVPPHLRCMLCVTCKRPSRKFLIGANHYSFPQTQPPAANEEVPASVPRV